MVESGNNISILIVRKNGSVNEFHGVTDISFQMRGGRVSRHSRSGKAEIVTYRNLQRQPTRSV